MAAAHVLSTRQDLTKAFLFGILQCLGNNKEYSAFAVFSSLVIRALWEIMPPKTKQPVSRKELRKIFVFFPLFNASSFDFPKKLIKRLAFDHKTRITKALFVLLWLATDGSPQLLCTYRELFKDSKSFVMFFVSFWWLYKQKQVFYKVLFPFSFQTVCF